MSALKDFSYKEDEDGELPVLVTGDEANLNDILHNVKSDGGLNIVNEAKIERANKQINGNQTESEATEGTTSLSRIPVTIITGYLGSGKSTLLEKIALKGSDRKIAVILNEFGDSSEIEKAMTIRNGSSSYQEWLDLGNGCLCCSLKNVGVKAIEDMIQRSPGNIDYILLETSGIADPAPIAKMFWQDEGLNSSVYIDGIVTVLDSANVLKCLDDVSPETHWHGEKVVTDDNLTIAHYQLAMADRIILNKFDKVGNDKTKITALRNKINEINSVAPVYETKYGELSLDKVLDLHAYDSVKNLENNVQLARPTLHDSRMKTIALSFRPLQNRKEFDAFIKNFIQPLLWKDFGASIEEGFRHSDWEIQRTKGLILIHDQDGYDTKVLQGVRDTYDIFPGKFPDNMNYPQCKIVFIGKHLNKEEIETSLHRIIGI